MRKARERSLAFCFFGGWVVRSKCLRPCNRGCFANGEPSVRRPEGRARRRRLSLAPAAEPAGRWPSGPSATMDGEGVFYSSSEFVFVFLVCRPRWPADRPSHGRTAFAVSKTAASKSLPRCTLPKVLSSKSPTETPSGSPE
jgi:hypothetical protein